MYKFINADGYVESEALKPNILSLQPIVKEKIWGVENWLVSGMPGNATKLVGGYYDGTPLDELLQHFNVDVVGERAYRRYRDDFPILLKTITTHDLLSVQVHPNDGQALETDDYGKSEMWYVIDAEPDTSLMLGFQQPMSRPACERKIADGTLQNALNTLPVTQGDTFMIPANTIHALGKGLTVAEVQEPSDVTYRLYDYHRKDADGHERELHITDGLEVCSYACLKKPRIHYDPYERCASLIDDEHFKVHRLRRQVDDGCEVLRYNDTFAIFLCVKGQALFDRELVNVGDVKFLPAISQFTYFEALTDDCTILQITF